MKGLVFTEYVEFLEENFGFDFVDMVIENSKLENNGSFTQAGNYPFEYMLKIIIETSKLSHKGINDILFEFGRYLFQKIINIYPQVVTMVDNTIDFISIVDTHIHVEVKKLYPDAQLPKFEIIEKDKKRLVINYKSNKPLQDLARGLMVGCSDYYGEKIDIKIQNLEDSNIKFFIEII